MHFLSLYAFKSLFYGVTVSPTVIFRTPRIIGRQITSKKITGYYNSVASPGSEAVLSEYLMIHVSCMQSSFPYSSKDTNTGPLGWGYFQISTKTWRWGILNLFYSFEVAIGQQVECKIIFFCLCAVTFTVTVLDQFASSCIETNMLVASRTNYIPFLKFRVVITMSKLAFVRNKLKLKVRRAC